MKKDQTNLRKNLNADFSPLWEILKLMKLITCIELTDWPNFLWNFSVKWGEFPFLRVQISRITIMRTSFSFDRHQNIKATRKLTTKSSWIAVPYHQQSHKVSHARLHVGREKLKVTTAKNCLNIFKDLFSFCLAFWLFFVANCLAFLANFWTGSKKGLS